MHPINCPPRKMDRDNGEIYSRHLAVVRRQRLCLDKLPFTNMYYNNTNEKKYIYYIILYTFYTVVYHTG